MKQTGSGMFSRFVATLDTNGGHIICGFILLLFGAAMMQFKLPKAEDVLVGGLTVVGMSMRGRGSDNHNMPTPADGSGATTRQTTETLTATEPKQ